VVFCSKDMDTKCDQTSPSRSVILLPLIGDILLCCSGEIRSYVILLDAFLLYHYYSTLRLSVYNWHHSNVFKQIVNMLFF
jgi:hypothetical protein